MEVRDGRLPDDLGSDGLGTPPAPVTVAATWDLEEDELKRRPAIRTACDDRMANIVECEGCSRYDYTSIQEF